MSVVHATNSSFQQDVVQKKGLVLVDFFAEWCGPCKIVAPIIDDLAKTMTDVTFVKVNVDENQEVASKYSVFSIPTFIVFKDGQVVDQFVGALSKEAFVEKLQQAKSK